MATSSITKNFIISGNEQVEKFVAAIDSSEKDKSISSYTPAHTKELRDAKAIKELMRKSHYAK